MNWRVQIAELSLAVLRRTTREISPTQCYGTIDRILDQVYDMGKEANRVETDLAERGKT